MDKPVRNIDWLYDAPDKVNLAKELTDHELSMLAQEVIRMYDVDRANRQEWDSQSERALKLAKQVLEKRTTPWPGASNVKHPLITIATVQFAARAYPEICKGNKVVKCQITGDDKKSAPAGPGQAAGATPSPALPAASPGPAMGPTPAAQPQAGPAQSQSMQPMAGMQQPGQPSQQQPPTPIQRSEKQKRADRITQHMNWQLTQEMSDWEADMDCLLHVLPVVGQCYKKTYFSGQDDHNISELVLPDDCVVSKGRSRDIKKARRITHRLWIYANEAIEKMNAGIWLDTPLGQARTTDNDMDAPHEFLEQHCYFDLDEDGYKEPYIVTVHKETGKTVRVAARWVQDSIELDEKAQKLVRIIPDHYFTHYGFIPNPDGSINYLGFGQLLEPINASANTVLNQLLDSGTLYNAGGGFIGRGVRLRGGTWSFKPGEWKMVDVQGQALKENLVPLPVKEPSTVLFQLLGFLITAGQEISSVQNVLTGDAKLAANMPVGTMMALVEQGLKVFTAIYKRIYRSLSEEFKKLYLLNARFLEPHMTYYVSGQDDEAVAQKADYEAGNTLVMPVADPEMSSDMQRLLKAQALKELSGRPGLNEIAVTRRLVTGIRPDNMEELLLTDGQMNGTEATPWKPPPSPQQILAQSKAVRMQQQAQESQIRLQMDMVKFQLELQELEDRVANIRADTMLKLAKADDLGRADLMEVYKTETERIMRDVEQKITGVKKGVEQFTAGSQGPQGQGLIPGRQGGGPVEAGNPIL